MVIHMATKPVPFSKRLTALRKVAGISMYELAKRSGVSKQALSALEKGQYKPSWETVCAIADALQVDVSAFREK
jgi:putative transcriptional regulator